MKEAFNKMEQKVHDQEEAIAQLYWFTGDHEHKFCVVEKELNTTYKAVLEAQVEMAVLHDGCCCCGIPGGRHNPIELTEEEEESEGSRGTGPGGQVEQRVDIPCQGGGSAS